MVAVDDSKGMSEHGCGDIAVEAVVTVCRALAQLEMGSLAVASFGKEGSMRLLHDFDRPFTAEAGTKVQPSEILDCLMCSYYELQTLSNLPDMQPFCGLFTFGCVPWYQDSNRP